MATDFLEISQSIDPRRGGACAYCDDAYRQALAAWVYFDSEIWLVHARAKEPMMAQIRLQFWVDFINQIDTKSPFDEISAALIYLIKGGYIRASDVLGHIESHFEKINDDNIQSSYNIFKSYFDNAAKIFGVDNFFSADAAKLIINSIQGDFKNNPELIAIINKNIKNHKNKNKIIDIILFLRLTRTARIYNDLLGDDKKRVGVIANMHLFWGKALGRI